MGTHCALLLADLFLYSYEAEFIQIYVLVPADKASNNIVFVCRAHYYQCIINELGINSTTGNRTCSPNYFFQR